MTKEQFIKRVEEITGMKSEITLSSDRRNFQVFRKGNEYLFINKGGVRYFSKDTYKERIGLFRSRIVTTQYALSIPAKGLVPLSKVLKERDGFN